VRNSEAAICLAVLLALPLFAQNNTEKPASDKPATVEGTVTNSVTGLPIPRAHISLQGGNSQGSYGAVSSLDGRFSITGLKPGSYSAVCQKVGFTESHGNRFRLTLQAGDSKTDADIHMTPLGSITGRVTDSDGEPIEGASVSAEGSGVGNGESGFTDDMGVFRIGGLAPGRYSVKAEHSDIFMGRPEIRTDGTVEVHNASTYYPGVISKKEAGHVTVRPGEDTGGIDIQLVRVPFVRVSGKVLNMPARVDDAYINVSQGTHGDGDQLRPDGTFEVWRLDPGEYTLSAEWNAPNGSRVRTVGTDIEVAGSNIDGIELRVVPDSDIVGHLEFEDEDARKLPQQNDPENSPEPDPPVGSITLNPASQNDESGGSSPIAADGTFHLKKVPAARYHVRVRWGTSYVKSMRLGSTAIDGGTLDLSNGSAGADLSVLMSATTSTVSGKVEMDSGSAADTVVVLYTSDGENWTTVEMVPVKDDGTYSKPSVAPGTYRIVAMPMEEMENPSDDPEYRDHLETIEVGPKDKVTKDLKRWSPPQ